MTSTAAAYGIYPDEVEVAGVMYALNGAGFQNENICLMVAPTHPIANTVRTANVLSDETVGNSVTAGLIGWLSQFGAVVIPTVGFFIRSQAFLHALTMVRDAPVLCGNAKTLVGLGFPDAEAERFEDELLKAGILVYVACPESARVGWAIEILRRTGARETAALEKAAEAGTAA